MCTEVLAGWESFSLLSLSTFRWRKLLLTLHKDKCTKVHLIQLRGHRILRPKTAKCADVTLHPGPGAREVDPPSCWQWVSSHIQYSWK